MLDLGFIHALKRIVSLVPPKRQTLFFSATMPRAIKELADKYLTNPAEVSVTPAATTVRADRAECHDGEPGREDGAARHGPADRAVERALVFSRTKHGADKIVRQLEAAGIAAGAIHGNKSQAQRERAIAAFKSGDMRVLVATDIAARGIDIPGVSHVVNYDLPDVPEQYVHRIGRTARAGADGIAIAFCSPEERGNLRDIERTTRQKIDVAPLPADFMANAEAFKRLKPAPKAAAAAPRRSAPRPIAAATVSAARTAIRARDRNCSVMKARRSIAPPAVRTVIPASTIPGVVRAMRRIGRKAGSAATASHPTARKRIAELSRIVGPAEASASRSRTRDATTTVPTAASRSASSAAAGAPAASSGPADKLPTAQVTASWLESAFDPKLDF